MSSSTEVVVIGGGLIGAACAVGLAHRGFSVALVDPLIEREGASFGNAGHIATEQVEPLASFATLRSAVGYLGRPDAPLSISASYLPRALPWFARFVWASRPSAYGRGLTALSALQRHAMRDLRSLLASVDAESLLHRRGHLMAFESAEPEAAGRELQKSARLGVAARRATSAQLEALAAVTGRPFPQAIHFTDSGHVDDPAAVRQALLDGLRAKGGAVTRGRAVTVRPSGRGYEIQLADGSLSAEYVVLAAGAWSAPLARGLGVAAPIEVERGYHVTLPHAQFAATLPVAFAERKVILTPMSCGLRIAGFVEFAGREAPPRLRRYAALLRHMQALAPGASMEDASLWMGFRPSLPDHLPAIGRLPGHDRVIAAYGHQHLGLTLCGVTARLVADLVQGTVPDPALQPFAPGRF